MKRFALLLLLLGVIFPTTAQQITYQNLTDSSSPKDFKDIEITSYVSSSGKTYQIGDVIYIGSKSQNLTYKHLLTNTAMVIPYNISGYQTEINKFIVTGNSKNGLKLKVLIKNISSGLVGFVVKDFEAALQSGEIAEKKPISQKKSNQSTTENIAEDLSLTHNSLQAMPYGDYNSYIASDGTHFIAGETIVTFGSVFGKKYSHINAPTSLDGKSALVTRIFLKTSKKNNIVMMWLQVDDYSSVCVKSVEDALAVREIFIKKPK